MAELGIGKNMVTSVRHWAEAAGTIRFSDGLWIVSDLGNDIFGPAGCDPYLDDMTTLWLIHWNFASSLFTPPMFAWEVFFGRWREPEFTRSQALAEFRRIADAAGRKVSDVTLEQHLDVFIHTYVAQLGGKRVVAEESLDSPLTELELIRATERRSDGAGEQVFSYPRSERPGITPDLFAYCVASYWRTKRPNEQTLTFSDLSSAPGSVGQVFRLTEADLRRRIECVEDATGGALTYRYSHGNPVVIAPDGLDRLLRVRSLYRRRPTLPADVRTMRMRGAGPIRRPAKRTRRGRRI
jgi:hypothetical protein